MSNTILLFDRTAFYINNIYLAIFFEKISELLNKNGIDKNSIINKFVEALNQEKHGFGNINVKLSDYFEYNKDNLIDFLKLIKLCISKLQKENKLFYLHLSNILKILKTGVEDFLNNTTFSNENLWPFLPGNNIILNNIIFNFNNLEMALFYESILNFLYNCKDNKKTTYFIENIDQKKIGFGSVYIDLSQLFQSSNDIVILIKLIQNCIQKFNQKGGCYKELMNKLIKLKNLLEDSYQN